MNSSSSPSTIAPAGGENPIDHPAVKEACERVTLAMAGRGRVLLRKSGTEPLVRVMVEGDDETQVRGHADDLAKEFSPPTSQLRSSSSAMT